MSNILITVNEQVLSVTSQPKIASEGVNEDYVIFNLDSNLSGYGLNAVFWKEGEEETVYQSAVDASGKALVPWEVMNTDGKIYIGLCGVKNNVIYTSEVIKYKIVKGKYGGNASSTPPTPGIYEQMLAVAASMHEEYDTLNTVLSAKIDTETTARQTGDTSLTAQIAAERARIDALIAGGSSSVSETVLYEGLARISGTSYALEDSIENYDYLDIYTYCWGYKQIKTVPAESGQLYTISMLNISDYSQGANYPDLDSGEIALSFAANTMSINNHSYIKATNTAFNAVGGQVSSGSTQSMESGGYIYKVVGRKKIANTEVEDIRTGYDGTTYNTAGAAVRGQITELSDKIDDAILDLGFTSMELLNNGNVQVTFGGGE